MSVFWRQCHLCGRNTVGCLRTTIYTHFPLSWANGSKHRAYRAAKNHSPSSSLIKFKHKKEKDLETIHISLRFFYKAIFDPKLKATLYFHFYALIVATDPIPYKFLLFLFDQSGRNSRDNNLHVQSVDYRHLWEKKSTENGGKNWPSR